tara:strand:- start:386 stop:1681 length:1296 start_codon:yes stop_codon:yes gene_type:complete
MAENVVTKFFKSFTNKSFTGNGVLNSNISPQSHNTLSLQTVNDFFNFNQGKSSMARYVKAYGSNPLVYMIVKKIAFTSASIKRVTINQQGDKIDNSELIELLQNPNVDQGQVEFLEQVNEYLSTTGNAFVRFVAGVGGVGNQLLVLIAQNIVINCDSIGEVISYTYTYPSNGGGKEVTFLADEILHLKTSNIVNVENTHIKYGLSPLQAAWVSVCSSSEKFTAEASIFENRGIVGLLTNDSDIPMTGQERDKQQNVVNGNIGGASKFNGISVTTANMRYVQLGMSPTDLKLLEGIVSSLRIICSIYGMPSVLFNDNERSTFNNYEQAVKTAYNDVYIPLANKVDRELSRFLNKQLGTNEFISADLTSIEVIKASTNDVAQALNSLGDRLGTIAIQSLTPDEVRDLLGLGVLTEGQVTIAQAAINNTPPTNE